MAKRAAIVRSATLLFSRYGFRKTSIDLIAADAGVAKPTIYAHFADKDALFAAVCEALARQILEDARAAAARHGSVVERVTAVLGAKFTTLFSLVESSPHARELLESPNDAARRMIEVADREYMALLTELLRDAARAGELDLDRLGHTPGALARLLLRAGHGAGYGETSTQAQRNNIRALVALALLGGVPRDT